MPDAQHTADIIERLISIHGEQGLSPSGDDWRTIFAVGEDGPVHILNLLKFRSRVDTPDGAISGSAAYRRYSSGNAGAFARVGGEVVFFGRPRHVFALGDVDEWDAVVLVRYPSAKALAEMWLDPQFIEAHANRIDGVERSQALVFGG